MNKTAVQRQSRETGSSASRKGAPLRLALRVSLSRAKQYWFVLVPPIFYLLTASRYLGSPDTAILMDAMMKPCFSVNACNHNLTNLLGYLIHHLPVGTMIFRFHLVSVLCGSVTIILFYHLLLRLGGRQATSALCSSVFMVSHSMWWHSTVVENYALSLVFLMTSLILVAAGEENRTAGPTELRIMAGLFFIAGLSLFNHIQNGVLTLASLLYFLLMTPRFHTRIVKAGVIAASAYLVGLTPYFLTFLWEVFQSADRFETLHWAIGGGFTRLMFNSHIVPSLSKLGHWIFLQFPSPFLLFIGLGIGLSITNKARRIFFVFLYTILLINTAFFMQYETWDQFAFYLPSFTALAILGSYAVIRISNRLKTSIQKQGLLLILLVCAVLPIFIYSNISLWSRGNGYWGRQYGFIERVYRPRYDLAAYIANPNKRNSDSIERFVRQVLEKLPHNAILIDDCSTSYQIEFLQNHEGLRPDIEVKLIRPMGIQGWGLDPEAIIHLVQITSRPVFFITSTGPCGEIVNCIAGKDRQLKKFPLTDELYIYQLLYGRYDL